jgi:streptomycin 6-kinase
LHPTSARQHLFCADYDLLGVLRRVNRWIVRPLDKRQCQYHGSTTVTEIKLHTGLIVPERVITTINAFVHQDFTPNWLSSLPTFIEALCTKWQIALEPRIADTWMTVVVFGTSPELGPVVIKSSPNVVDFVAQARAFEIGAGDHVPRLYDLDLAHCTMVIERIVPGTELRYVAMDDDVAARIAAETLRTFWRPVADGEGLIPQRRVLQPLFDWTPWPELIETNLVAQAQQLATLLLERSTHTCLVHGDFHHWNVLRRTSGAWMIIDPVGIVGDHAADIARWMHNPPEIVMREDFLDVAARRISIWADVTGIDADVLASWALVGNVLNAINCTTFAPEVMQTCIRVAQRLQTLVRR